MNDKNKEMRMVLYHAQDDDVSVNALIENETLWVTQKAMAELFDVDRSVITKHLSNIYSDNELSKEATCAKIAQVQNEGGRSVTRKVEYYSLDAIISVGYRVNSKKATAFRIWATNVLKAGLEELRR